MNDKIFHLMQTRSQFAAKVEVPSTIHVMVSGTDEKQPESLSARSPWLNFQPRQGVSPHPVLWGVEIVGLPQPKTGQGPTFSHSLSPFLS